MNKVEKHKRSKILRSEFHRDARVAVIDYVKELYPKTWIFHLFISFVWLEDSYISYLKYSPYWYDQDHWFFKKWDFSRTGWYSEYIGYLKEEPDIKFKFHADLIFSDGF